MNIDDIMNALSKEKLGTAMGLRPAASMTGDLVSALSLFGTGMILGAGLALLFAPMAGREIRSGIADKVGELGDQLRADPVSPAFVDGAAT